MSLVDGDADGNVNPFWDDRNYNNDVGNIKASVFVAHGLNDDNVKTDQFGEWWAKLAARMSRARSGSASSATWTRSTSAARSGGTIHRWYDYWLQGIPTGS